VGLEASIGDNMKSTARLVELQQQREQEAQRDRDQVFAEFGGDPRAMADEILCLRRGLKVIADAVGLAQQGALFSVLRPGPYWRPRAAGVPSREVDGGSTDDR
jgi:hypothetical protein